jgi:hypothetical protein
MTKFFLSLAIDLVVLWAVLAGLDFIFPGITLLDWDKPLAEQSVSALVALAVYVVTAAVARKV